MRVLSKENASVRTISTNRPGTERNRSVRPSGVTWEQMTWEKDDKMVCQRGGPVARLSYTMKSGMVCEICVAAVFWKNP